MRLRAISSAGCVVVVVGVEGGRLLIVDYESGNVGWIKPSAVRVTSEMPEGWQTVVFATGKAIVFWEEVT